MGAVCFIFFLATALAAASGSEAALVEHTFIVSQIKVNHLCNESEIIVVNGQLPGPTIEVTEGDSVVVHVVNKLPGRGVTIHWHGVKQQLNCWNDGPAMVTQCPIQPNKNFTYRFNVTGQEGTLWWHAHVGCLRSTVHGALIIRPRSGRNSYPFPKPDKEIPIVLGEWWQISLDELEKNIAKSWFRDMPISNTFNGKLGDLNNCSGFTEENYELNVEHGKTYLLRLVNAALHSEFYFKIAGHIFTVVGADANYVKPYTTDVIAMAPGETVDALVIADAPPGKYYMGALTIQSPEPMRQFPVILSRAIVSYNSSSKGYDDTLIVAPEMPIYNDQAPTYHFHGNLTSLPHPLLPPVPTSVDERWVIATDTGDVCKTLVCGVVLARMNNISFHLTATTPLLQAHYYKNSSNTVGMLRELSTTPPDIDFNEGGVLEATGFRRVRYNTTVEVVFQGPPVGLTYPNPMHLHGHDVFILAQGIGMFDPKKDVAKFNLVDPPARNMVNVPRWGWTALRFVTNNPGVWFWHCHIEMHAESGMAMVLVVEDGPTLDTALPSPPADYPSCGGLGSKVADE